MPQLPPEWIAHFKAGPSLRLGSCSASGRPGITKALAADVLPDGRVMVLASRRAVLSEWSYYFVCRPDYLEVEKVAVFRRWITRHAAEFSLPKGVKLS